MSMKTHNLSIEEKKRFLLQNNISAPWKETFGWSIDQLSDQQLKEQLEPWTASFTGKKKLEFISVFVKNHLLKTPGVVLEVGCGAGGLCRFLAKNGVEDVVVGCDISPSAIRCAQSMAEAEGLSPKFLAANFMEDGINFENSNISIILMDSVLEHVIEYKALISKVHSLLKKNGKCLVIVPSVLGAFSLCHDFDYTRLQWKDSPHNYHPGAHCNHFWFSHLKQTFFEAGFHYERVFKFQAFNAFMQSLLKFIKAQRFFKCYTIADYYIAKLLPNDIATRIAVFRKN